MLAVMAALAVAAVVFLVLWSQRRTRWSNLARSRANATATYLTSSIALRHAHDSGTVNAGATMAGWASLEATGVSLATSWSDLAATSAGSAPDNPYSVLAARTGDHVRAMSAWVGGVGAGTAATAVAGADAADRALRESLATAFPTLNRSV
jgi:hypothetical protein